MTSTEDSIVILATGGTIDKTYTLAGDLDVGPPAASELLGSVVLEERIEVVPVLARDSLDMTDEDRDLLAARVRALPHRRIVITHGTDTMDQTAVRLAQDVPAGRTVVLTGAMQPAAMRRSDAPFNLGFAVAAAQLAPPGVYVAMSGRLFPAGDVVKDRATGLFRRLR